MSHELSEEEKAAFEAWQRDHPEDKDCKHWHQLPWWVQKAYLRYQEME
jgi:hypothetical protein